MINLQGGVCIVFGGARGIGKAMVEMFLQNQCKVMIADILKVEGLKLKSELEQRFAKNLVEYINCDVTDTEHIKRVFISTSTTFGEPRVVINSAGIMDEKDWMKTIRINLEGAFDINQQSISAMSLAQGHSGGIVIHIASINGLLAPAHCPAYSTSKAGIIAMVRSFGRPEHFNVHGIRFHALCPAGTDTELPTRLYSNGQLQEQLTELPKQRQRSEQVTGQKNVLQTPESVASAAQRLLEREEVRNGQVVVVVGGQSYVEEETRAAFYTPLMYH